MNPYAFWGMSLSHTLVGFIHGLQAMVTIPTPMFCSSTHPCSCTGGGFELYDEFCRQAEHKSNGSADSNFTTHSTNLTAAKNEFASVFVGIIFVFMLGRDEVYKTELFPC